MGLRRWVFTPSGSGEGGEGKEGWKKIGPEGTIESLLRGGKKGRNWKKHKHS